MLEFLNKIFSNSFLSTAFSGFGTSICEKLSKKSHIKNLNKKHNPKSDKEIILHAIEYYGASKQKEIFVRYFYKYKNKFSDDDVETLKEKSAVEHPNYCILLNVLLGLIESIN